MKNNGLPTNKEWKKIIDNAFSEGEDHVFSQEYEQRKRDIQRSVTMKNDDKNLTVNTVEPYKRPKLAARAGAFAASIAVLAAIGAVPVMKLVNGNSPDPTFTEMSEIPAEETTEETTEEPTEEVTEEIFEETAELTESDLENEADEADSDGFPENTYDMTVKEGIFAKMINSIDFYDKISGKLVTIYCPGCPGSAIDMPESATTIDFSYDVTTAKSHADLQTLNLKNSYTDLINGDLPNGWEGYKAFSSEGYCDGQKAYILNPNVIDGLYSDYQYSGTVSPRDDNEVNVAQALDSWNADSLCTYAYAQRRPDKVSNNKLFRSCGPMFGYAYLDPWEYVYKCLSDFDTWSFEPTEFIGRDAVAIEGTIAETNYEFNDLNPSGDRFSMIVDTETGLMLKYVEYYPDGEIYDFMVMHELYLNDDAAPVKEYDMSQFRQMTDDDIKQGLLKNYRVNSSGQTYGYSTTYHLHKGTNLDDLPDLYEFMYAYVKSDEFIDLVGDVENTYDLQYSFDPLAQEAEYEIPLYDHEGEYLKTVYFYK